MATQGRVVLVTGASGGPTIISGVFTIVSNVLDHGMDAAAAVAAPRIHHQHLPDRLIYEREGLAPAQVRALQGLLSMRSKIFAPG